MSIEQAIKCWDGKSTACIGGIYKRYGNNDGFIQEIIQLAAVPAGQNSFFEMAMRAEAPSAKARIRNLMRKACNV